MVKLTIDGHAVEAVENTTILEAARDNGILIPTLCYFQDLNEIGACRVCLVEIKGMPRLYAACNTHVAEGMEVLTNSARVQTARRINVQLIMAQHRCHCLTCARSGNCALQNLAAELNILDQPFDEKLPRNDWDTALPLIRTEDKCIKCFRCVNVCDKIQGLRVWQVNGTGAHTTVTVRDGLSLKEAGCTLCGQCVTHCPVGALTVRDDTAKVVRALHDPQKVVVMQVAPAVRTAWGEALGLASEMATVPRMVAAAKELGVDYVLDTNFTADLTIMEEGTELLERLQNPGKAPMPMFTSCCPGWVRFVKLHYPQLADHLSTAKSPQQMFGAVIKSYFAKKLNVDPETIFCVSVMPCSAKKYECDVPEVNASERDVDVVLTTREFARMLRMNHVNPEALNEEEFDTPLGKGAGVIFGATGGVMEQALRSAYFLLNGENPKPEDFHLLRNAKANQILSAEYTLAGKTVRAAVVSGLTAAREICEQVLAGTAPYDFIEIMACPGGCVGGGGQPILEGTEQAEPRKKIIYRVEQDNPYLYAHENPAVKELYADHPGEEGREELHHLLHTRQADWTI